MEKEVNGWRVVETGKETTEEELAPVSMLTLGHRKHKAVEIREEDESGEFIPAGYRKLKNVTGVYLSNDEIVITGDPDGDDETHSCDKMGCSSVSHVIFRANILETDR